MARQLIRLLRFAWPSPCSAVGAVFAVLVILLGGSCRRVGGAIEVALRAQQAQVPPWAARSAFGGITLGHVILGQSHELLAHLRAHERVHVRQYEVLGPLFFLAYPLASLCAGLRGRSPYSGNFFEMQAHRQSLCGRENRT
ncbi:MAG: hypothetical protein MUE86_04020 [Thiobacillaceae bacterium]|jgi:hypothetical protein|nr:hypothetical protein [Thiobacillaceae bacterium]